MAPKWPMRQNSSAKTALNSTEGAEIQCTWRPSENYRAESAITKRAAREQKHRLPLLRSDLDFYVWGIFQATHSNICWGWASSPRTRKTPGGSDRLPTPGTSTGTMSQVHAHTSLKKKKKSQKGHTVPWSAAAALPESNLTQLSWPRNLRQKRAVGYELSRHLRLQLLDKADSTGSVDYSWVNGTGAWGEDKVARPGSFSLHWKASFPIPHRNSLLESFTLAQTLAQNRALDQIYQNEPRDSSPATPADSLMHLTK